MAIDENGILYDPFGGQKDLEARKLRNVSDAFSEDPLRVLRIARFAAKLHFQKFTISKNTYRLIQKIILKNELEALSGERIFQEFIKAFQTQNPETFIQVLQQLGVFLHILKPLNKVSKSHLIPVLYAIKKNCCDINILLAITLSKLSHKKELTEVLSELKVTKKTHLLCMNVFCHHNFFSTLQNHCGKDILQTLKAINALRNKSNFKQFILTLQYINRQNDLALSNLQLTKEIQEKLISHHYLLVIQDIQNKKEIADNIIKSQLLIIKETCHRIMLKKS